MQTNKHGCNLYCIIDSQTNNYKSHVVCNWCKQISPNNVIELRFKCRVSCRRHDYQEKQTNNWYCLFEASCERQYSELGIIQNSRKHLNSKCLRIRVFNATFIRYLPLRYFSTVPNVSTYLKLGCWTFW